mmetsp:Transcript_8125/g.10066  ORF Transcript_8125/g.10066 Transcript_8125/m.10066 type:complete len:331 (-) Transcript_8125:24-1016(-)
MRVGFLGEPEPRFTIPNIVGRPKGERVLHSNSDQSEEWIGDDAVDMKGILTLSSPIENGKIRNWDDLVLVWRYACSQLNIDSSKCSFLLCVPEYITREDQEQIKRIFWNEFSALDVSVITEAISVASLCDKSTSLVIDCGSSGARIIPVVDMKVLSQCTTRYMFGGYQADSYMARLLQESGYSFTTSSEIQLVKEIREENCYVSQDFAEESQKEILAPVECPLPDGQSVSLTKETFQCMEPFFNPSLVGIDEKGLHHQILRTLMKCPTSVRRSLLENIILVGGISKVSGFLERLGKELAGITPKGTVVKFFAAPNREELSWVGALHARKQ